MSKPLKTNTFECPACKAKGQLEFRKPSYFEPSITKYYCKECDTECLLKIKIDKLKQYKFDTKFIRIGAEIEKTMQKEVVEVRAAQKSKAAERARKAIESLQAKPNETT